MRAGCAGGAMPCDGVWVVKPSHDIPKTPNPTAVRGPDHGVGNVTGLRTAGGEWERGRRVGHLDKWPPSSASVECRGRRIGPRRLAIPSTRNAILWSHPTDWGPRLQS